MNFPQKLGDSASIEVQILYSKLFFKYIFIAVQTFSSTLPLSVMLYVYTDENLAGKNQLYVLRF